ncbi:hypothetical protein O181_067606 [Austropuccinia psidii MF-1]|uniref:Uncharacterized protein n=1 Tax=Austropuccinia psidii MF-1 TaxID=1389203 RepID=A0A9Q3I377_9BASI|nr:hypothetical protein [Austropuccinia psidii MF-1]
MARNGHKIKIHQESPYERPRHIEVFLRPMGTRHLEDFVQDISVGQKGSNIRLALGNEYTSYTHSTSFFEHKSPVAIILGYNPRPFPKGGGFMESEEEKEAYFELEYILKLKEGGIKLIWQERIDRGFSG